MEKDFEYKNIHDLNFEKSEIVDRKEVFNRKEIKFFYGELKPNKSIPLHKHTEEDQGGIILEGKGEYLAGNEKISIEKGTSWFVKAGVEHSMVNTGPGVVKYLEFVL